MVISLPPIKVRIRLTRELTHNYTGGYGHFLGDSEKVLKEHGCLVESALILDPGTELRIEAFKSFASSADWPNVKVTVRPDGGKDTKLYIPLVAFDGVSWELIKESPKSPPAPIKRITFDYDSYTWDAGYGFKGTSVYHDAFGREYNEGDKEKIINPLALDAKTLESGKFVVERETKLSSIVVKIGKEHWGYDVNVKKSSHFILKAGKGVTLASLDKTIFKVVLFSYFSKEVIGSKEFKKDEITKDSIKEFANELLKQKHGL
jgi:hypothetical protein